MKTRDTSKKERMYEAIQEWEGSGVSIRNYCHQRGIAYESFRYWKKKYSQEVSRQDFIPISLSSDFSVVPDGRTSGSVITITRPGGIRIECPTSIQLTILQTLIKP